MRLLVHYLGRIFLINFAGKASSMKLFGYEMNKFKFRNDNSKFMFVISIVLVSILTGCSNSNVAIEKDSSSICNSLANSFSQANLSKSDTEIEYLKTDILYSNQLLFQSVQNDKNLASDEKYQRTSSSLQAIVGEFINNDKLNFNSEFIAAMNNFLSVDCNGGVQTSSQQSNTPILDGNREACVIYFDAMYRAGQLPFDSPKLSYILRDGYSRAKQYADPDLALDFQILLDGVENSSDVIFDINDRCDQYK